MINNRKTNLIPVLSVKSSEILLKDCDTYPINVYFENTGKGTANFMVVDADRDDIRVNIGIPYSFGPGGNTNVRVFLNNDNKRECINLALYYWDIDDNCYRTRVKLDLKYGNHSERIFVPRHKFDSCKEKNKKMPSEILNWSDQRELFVKQKWDY